MKYLIDTDWLIDYLKGKAGILIAATAIDHDLMLVTQNLSHFHRIPNLMLYQQQ